jgi:hypothetical protein
VVAGGMIWKAVMKKDMGKSDADIFFIIPKETKEEEVRSIMTKKVLLLASWTKDTYKKCDIVCDKTYSGNIRMCAYRTINKRKDVICRLDIMVSRYFDTVETLLELIDMDHVRFAWDGEALHYTQRSLTYYKTGIIPIYNKTKLTYNENKYKTYLMRLQKYSEYGLVFKDVDPTPSEASLWNMSYKVFTKSYYVRDYMKEDFSTPIHLLDCIDHIKNLKIEFSQALFLPIDIAEKHLPPSHDMVKTAAIAEAKTYLMEKNMSNYIHLLSIVSVDCLIYFVKCHKDLSHKYSGFRDSPWNGL